VAHQALDEVRVGLVVGGDEADIRLFDLAVVPTILALHFL